MRLPLKTVAVALLVFTAGCFHHRPPAQTPLQMPQTASERSGEEIVVCGQLYHVGAPIVLWCDKGGYDMYNAGPTTLPATRPTPSRRLLRTVPLTDAQIEQVHKDGWTLPLLQQTVDQFVLHYDVAGVSRNCFNTLKARHLGVQFMCDIDGTIYQTMDLQDIAPHATKANGRSVGVEIANMGAYADDTEKLAPWYHTDEDGNVRITLPERVGDGGVRTPNFVGGPARKELVEGPVNGQELHQYDFTPQQYESLIKLTAALCTVFPKIQADYPRQKMSLGAPATQRSKIDGDPTTRPSAIATPHQPGMLIPHTLSDDQYNNYQGVLGHYHVQTDKIDPGPAFQWHGFMQSVRARMTPGAVHANERMFGQPARYTESGPTSRPSRGNWRMRSSATTRAATQP